MCTPFQELVAGQAYAPHRGSSVHREHIFHHETNEAFFCACRTRTCPIHMCQTQACYRNDSALRPSALRPSLFAPCRPPFHIAATHHRPLLQCSNGPTQSAVIIMMHLTNHKCDIHAAQGLPCLFVLPSSQDYNNGTKKSAHHSSFANASPPWHVTPRPHTRRITM